MTEPIDLRDYPYRISGAARRKVTPKIKKRYLHGVSIRRLAEETGRSYGFIHRILVEAGVTLRSRGRVDPNSARRKLKKAPGDRGSGPAEQGGAPPGAQLSPRELDILRLMRDGLTNPEIADEFEPRISEETVKMHVRRVFQKLDVVSRTQAVVVGLRAGIITFETD